MFPGVWRHGDWIKLTDRGTAVIYGRSDSTINRGGVRMGTSEIYSAVEGVPEVLDSLVVDVEDQMILFVVLREALTDELSAEIRRRVREHCSPRHIPDRIVQIDEVPRTLSNKKLEVPVKKILLGAAPESAASRDSLANPAALDFFSDFSVSGGLSSSSSRSANSTQNSSTSASVSSSRRSPSPMIVTAGICADAAA